MGPADISDYSTQTLLRKENSSRSLKGKGALNVVYESPEPNHSRPRCQGPGHSFDQQRNNERAH